MRLNDGGKRVVLLLSNVLTMFNYRDNVVFAENGRVDSSNHRYHHESLRTFKTLNEKILFSERMKKTMILCSSRNTMFKCARSIKLKHAF